MVINYCKIVIFLSVVLESNKVKALLHANFSVIVKINTFVDKSLLIKDFMSDDNDVHDPPVTALNAPGIFGKSSAIHMTRLFLEIIVDEKGKTIAPIKTINYRLFCGGDGYVPLKICENKTFVNEHLGRHPVVHVDYRPLESADSFKSLRVTFKPVLRSVFLKHDYLLENSTLWSNESEKKAFVRYIHPRLYTNLTTAEIVDGYRFLIRLLFAHFGKRVIVLIDDYDTYIASLLFNKVKKVEFIISFFTYVNGFLFERNGYINRVLITGRHRVTGLGVLPDNVVYHRFCGDHKFSQYFGITRSEIDEILMRNFNDTTERENIRNTLQDYYEGYVSQNGERLYSCYSIDRFFKNKMNTDTYWVTFEQYIRCLSRFFKERGILDEIKELVDGRGYVLADISTPLSKDVVCKFNKLTVYELWDDVNKTEIERFWVRIYDLGYLTVLDGHEKQQSGLVPMKIPNKEILSQYLILLEEDEINNREDLGFFSDGMKDDLFR